MRRQSTSKKKKTTIGGTGVSPVSSEIQITHRNLPHWQQGGATYFVTFRVKRGTLSEEERRLVLAACLHWHQRKWRLYAAVVMPDHAHLLAQPLSHGKNQWYALGEILHSVKSYSTHQVNKHRRTAGTVWLDESFDRIVRDEAEFREKLLYMAHNPVKAGLARTEGGYPYFWIG
ncbi:MAG: transposase [Terriglobia bacterium]